MVDLIVDRMFTNMQQMNLSLPMNQQIAQAEEDEQLEKVRDKGSTFCKSWFDLIGSLCKYQNKLLVKEQSISDREKLIRVEEERLQLQKQTWPEQVLKLESDLRVKEQMNLLCKAELVNANKMAEMVDAEHAHTREILEHVQAEKDKVENKCTQYEIDLNAISSELKACREELEIKDQLVSKLEQQMVKEIAESMAEITSLKGLVESKEGLLDEEKRLHDETRMELRQLQASHRALKNNLGSQMSVAPSWSQQYNQPTMSGVRSNVLNVTANSSRGPPSKIRRVVTNTCTTENYSHNAGEQWMTGQPNDGGVCTFPEATQAIQAEDTPQTSLAGSSVIMGQSKEILNPVMSCGFDWASWLCASQSSIATDANQKTIYKPSSQGVSKNTIEKQPSNSSSAATLEPKKHGPKPGWKARLAEQQAQALAFTGKKRGPKPGWKKVSLKQTTLKSEVDASVDEQTPVRKKPGPKPGWKSQQNKQLLVAGNMLISGRIFGPKSGWKAKCNEQKKKAALAGAIRVKKRPGPKPGWKARKREEQARHDTSDIGQGQVCKSELSLNLLHNSASELECKDNILITAANDGDGEDGNLRKTWSHSNRKKCAICGEEMSSLLMYARHAEDVHPGRPFFKCVKCGKDLKNPYRLNYHVKNVCKA